MRHMPPRDLVELSMHERNQPFEGALVALPPSEQQSGDVRGAVRNVRILALLGRPSAVALFGTAFEPEVSLLTLLDYRRRCRMRLLVFTDKTIDVCAWQRML
jgi:hypothetical protein